jgi:hypothetical protein
MVMALETIISFAVDFTCNCFYVSNNMIPIYIVHDVFCNRTVVVNLTYSFSNMIITLCYDLRVTALYWC